MELLEVADLLLEFSIYVHWLGPVSIAVGAIAGNLATAGDQEFADCRGRVYANEGRTGSSPFVMRLRRRVCRK
jgi:hypothetical protein